MYNQTYDLWDLWSLYTPEFSQGPFMIHQDAGRPWPQLCCQTHGLAQIRCLRADLNETRLLGTTPTDGLDIDETIDATKIIRFHMVFMKIQWWRGFYESDPVYHLLKIKLILSIYCVALLTISRKHSTSRKRSVAVLGCLLQYLEPDLLSLLR